MHLGSIYLIAKDFDATIHFYEELLQMKVTAQNRNRFAMFEFEGHCIAVMNSCYDKENPDQVVHEGTYDAYFDDLPGIAEKENTRKFVLNFWVEDLLAEHVRVKALHISERLTDIKYVCNVSPYYYFQLTDPDGNVIEVTGKYTPV